MWFTSWHQSKTTIMFSQSYMQFLNIRIHIYIYTFYVVVKPTPTPTPTRKTTTPSSHQNLLVFFCFRHRKFTALRRMWRSWVKNRTWSPIGRGIVYKQKLAAQRNINSFVRSSFVCSFVRSLVRSFIHSFIHSLTHWFSHSFIGRSMCAWATCLIEVQTLKHINEYVL